MREIKFRVWDKQAMAMFPVAAIHFGDNGDALTITIEAAPKGQYYKALVDRENGELMQYTGEKDKDGRDIYEGDILDVEGEGRFTVAWDTFEDCCVRGWTWMLVPAIYRGTVAYRADEAMVVGNIYDNPELVEATVEATV